MHIIYILSSPIIIKLHDSSNLIINMCFNQRPACLDLHCFAETGPEWIFPGLSYLAYISLIGIHSDDLQKAMMFHFRYSAVEIEIDASTDRCQYSS